MDRIVLCPNCGGQKTVSKPPYIAGDVNAWVGSGTPTYSCPTCDGKGWVDTEADSDFAMVKSIALSIMSTSETLMDECVKRGDRIKELESECDTIDKACVRLATKNILLENMLLRNEAETERLRVKIFDIEGREDLVTTELERRACVAEDKLRVVKEMRDELLEDWEKKRYAIVLLASDISQYEAERKLRIRRERELFNIINDLTDERERDEIELLDVILKTLNPLIKNGAYARPSTESIQLAIQMHRLCQTVVQYRRKHGIVG